MKKGLWLLISSQMVMALLIAGCTGPPEEPTESTTEIQETILGVSVSGLHISCPAPVTPDMMYKTARMWFDFEIHNPGEAEVILESFEYAVYGNEHTIAGADAMVRGEYTGRTVTPFGTTILEFQLPYISKDENSALWSDIVDGDVTWRIEGLAYIRTSTGSLDITFECMATDYTIDMDDRCLEE